MARSPESSDLNGPVLVASGISKQFPGVQALDSVSIELRAGEVTALVGENGAGKSTLIKILVGIFEPDEGEICVSDASVRFSSPRSAWAAGLAAIHQEVAMFDELSVAENIFMGHMPVTSGRLIDWPEVRRRTESILRSLSTRFTADTQLKQLGIGERHLVEVGRVLAHDARVVIMDEPTSALSSEEVEGLFRIIDRLKAEGRAILFISHKFDEIFRISDRWICLRDGHKVGEGRIAEVTQDQLVRLMVGRSIEQLFPKRELELGEIALEVEGLSDGCAYDDVSFTLRGGQIIGFYGLVGAGRSETMRALFGITKPLRGSIKVNGKRTAIRSPLDAIKAGIAYVPEDRQLQGAVLAFGIRENVTLANLKRYSHWGFLSQEEEFETTRTLGARFSVRAASWDQRVNQLSGGNQQKVVIAKWVATNPKILILDEPTKGVDIGSKAAVYEFMGELASSGLAIVLVSSELPEVMAMSDEILVMYAGRVVRHFSKGEATAESVVSYATGINVGR